MMLHSERPERVSTDSLRVNTQNPTFVDRARLRRLVGPPRKDLPRRTCPERLRSDHLGRAGVPLADQDKFMKCLGRAGG